MKTLTCLGIDQSSSDWSLWNKIIDRNLYLNFDKEKFPSKVYFCNKKNLNKEDKYREEIEILGRIGSPSADAEVYRIKVKGIEFAMKIMPRIDNDSWKKNQRELEIAEEASKYSDYFPKTFAKGYCPKSSFYIAENGDVSLFVSKAVDFFTYNQIKSKIINKNTLKRFDNDYRNGMDLEQLSKKYIGGKEEKEEKEEKGTIEVDFLISELCNGDMGNWMKMQHPIEDWRTILTNIIKGIYFLTGFLNVVHPDLHVGNILINTDKNPLALIHDFGRCYYIDDSTPQMYKGSLYSFCSEFISCHSTRNDLYIPKPVLVAITNILNYINKTEINKENMKYIYENFLIPIVQNL